MSDLTPFKNKIFLYGIFVAFFIQLVSLPFLGLDVKFSYGLAMGTAISIVNFNIMEYTLRRALSSGKSGLVFAGYVIRLLIYGGAFYMSLRVGTVSGIAALFGFLTLKISIYYLHGFKAEFSKDRKVRPEVKEAYEKMDASKEEHKTDRIRDKIRRELEYQEDEDFFGRNETEDGSADGFSAETSKKGQGKTYRSYKRKKLSRDKEEE